MAIPSVVRRHPLALSLSAVILLPIIVFTLWAFVTLHYTYSSGDRAGYLLKISKRGWLCKTWEGELQTTAIPGAAPEKFIFTTRDDQVAAELNRLIGQQVVLNYAQHKGVPSTCFGDTEYFITAARVVPSR